MLTNNQLSVFELLESVEDSGIDLERYIRDSETIRKRINRNFSNIGELSKVDSALYLFGYLDVRGIHSGKVSDYELLDCIEYINEVPDISPYKIKELSTLTSNPIKDLVRRLRVLMEDLVLDAVADIIYKSSGRLTMEDFKKIEGGRYFEGLSYKRFGGTLNFYESYGIDVKLFYLSKEYSRINYLFYLGIEFERLVRKWVFPNAPYQVVYKDCIPDFIIDGRWTDIKLSKSTVFLPMDNTINKYLKYVDKLTIIYALEDEVPDDFYEDYGFIELISIESFYGSLPSYAVSELEELKRSASEFKEAIR